MNGHALGERTGWVLAATLLAFGTVTGVAADHPGARPASPPAAATSVAARDAGSPTASPFNLAGTVPAWLTFGSHPSLADPVAGWPSSPSIRPAAPLAVVKPAPPKPAPPKPAPAPPAIWWSVYHGTNHVWMPTLGINRPVYFFPCSRGESPDNFVYRWGCAGTNNVYLLGHAYGVFKPLYNAYYNGRLRVGLPVIYADGHGRTHLYRVTTWRVVSPANPTWAMASQRVPSMTLQTCVGSDGTLRLVVRLVEVRA
jgi:hypothetical protein